MNTFYIVRHGETENNRARRLSGWLDTPLTASGLEPTKTVIAALRNVSFEAIYSSDVGRAFITAYVIACELAFNDEIKRLPGLREVNYGEAANMLSAEAYLKYPGLDSNTQFVPPGGESLDAMQQRVLATVAQLDRAHSDANILLVCHSGVMAALNASFLKQDFGAHNISEAYPHDYVGLFQVTDGVISAFEAFKG